MRHEDAGMALFLSRLKGAAAAVPFLFLCRDSISGEAAGWHRNGQKVFIDRRSGGAAEAIISATES